MTAQYSIKCHKLAKRFEDRVLFEGLDLEVVQGERVALLGASGAGKSTLLHCLSGVTQIDEGEIEIAATRIDSLSKEQMAAHRRRCTGTVFQFFHLLPTLTVYENVELPLQLNGMEAAGRASRVNALLQRMGISDRSRAFPGQLSGGEMQRVAIARAIAHRPAVLFADEPTGNLDRKSGDEVLALLREVTEEENAALLMVTHSEEAAAICQRQLELQDGQLMIRR